jgi:hypothetical protein
MWSTFALFQIAVVFGVVGLFTNMDAAVAIAGGVGFAGWLTMTANITGAWRRSCTNS